MWMKFLWVVVLLVINLWFIMIGLCIGYENICKVVMIIRI